MEHPDPNEIIEITRQELFMLWSHALNSIKHYETGDIRTWRAMVEHFPTIRRVFISDESMQEPSAHALVGRARFERLLAFAERYAGLLRKEVVATFLEPGDLDPIE